MIQRLMDVAIDQGHELLGDLLTRAVNRFGPLTARTRRLFSPAELEELAAHFASLNATAELFGRAQVRQMQRRALAAHGELEESHVSDSGVLQVPVVQQRTDFSCGRAATEAVLRFWGLTPTPDDLAMLGTTPDDGTTASAIIGVAKRLGLEAEEREGMTIEDIGHVVQHGVPVIAAVTMYGGSHWVVLAGLDDANVTMMDPAADVNALTTMPRDQWEKQTEWYGIAIGRQPLEESVHLSERVEGDPPKKPLPPRQALDYFTRLVPKLGTDPERFADRLERQAFTLAVATEKELLKKVQGFIADKLSTGEQFRAAPAQIDELLDAAGVGPRSKDYSRMVFRTNAMDSYNAGYERERTDPDVIATFPVWEYSNPVDSRSRPHHAERNGRYYPADVPFVQVRGEGIEDASNCRCMSIAVDKWDWKELKAAGARIADGYPDPTA